jgi:hypothetical protein
VSDGVAKAIVAVLLVVGAFTFGMWTGHQVGSHEREAERTREIARQFERYQEQVADGEATAEQLQLSLQRLSQHHATITGALRHAPLLARAPAALGALPLCPAAIAAAPGAAASPATNTDAAPADASAAPAEPGGGALLTLAAVSLWDSALAGHHVPAGACSTDGAAGAACAAPAPFDLQDAWANQAENAARCARNAERYRALIDYVTRQQARQGK